MKIGGQIQWNATANCGTFQDKLSDGKTPYERRFGKPFKGPIIPFGSLVEYYPISAKDQSRIHQFGKKVLPGMFLRYALYAGGIWKGDILVADIEELETIGDDGRIGNLLKKTQYERGDISRGKRRIVSNRRWTNQNPWRRSGPENIIHFSTASTNSRRVTYRLSWRIRRVTSPPQDSLPDAGEAINDSWSISGHFIYPHHGEPRVKL